MKKERGESCPTEYIVLFIPFVSRDDEKDDDDVRKPFLYIFLGGCIGISVHSSNV